MTSDQDRESRQSADQDGVAGPEKPAAVPSPAEVRASSEAPLDQAAEIPGPQSKALAPGSRTLALVAIWTVLSLAIYGLKLDALSSGLLWWLAGLMLLALGFHDLKLRAARQARILEEVKNQALQMERRSDKRSASLHLRQRQLQALMDSSESGIYLKNKHHEFVLINARFCSLMGARMDQLLGTAGYAFLKPSIAWKIMEIEQKVSREKLPLELQDLYEQAEDPEGRVISLHVFPVIGPGGSLDGIGGLVTDVTEPHRQGQELIRLRAEAQKAALAKRAFLANMSHEFRSPLNGIIGMADLLARSDLEDDQAFMAAIIKNAGNALLAALNDVLDLSRIEAEKLNLNARPFSLRGLIFEALKGLAPVARHKQLDFIVNISPRIPDALYGDDSRLRQVLLNLTANALKFSNSGQVRVTVGPSDPAEASPGPLAGRPAEAPANPERPEPAWSAETGPEALTGPDSGLAAACRLRFSVSDTGIGIPPDKQKIIFEAFEQADSSNTRNYDGAGLGLAICYRLAAMMNSKLQLESEEGRGSTFWLDLELQVVSEAALTPPAQLPPTIYESFQEARVLWLEAAEADRRTIRKGLQDWHIPNQEARDADQALKMLKAAAEAGRPFNLILAATRLRLKDGRDLSVVIKSEPGLAATPLVALRPAEARPDPPPPDRSFNAGLSRPIRTPELIRVIAAALGVWERFDSDSLTAGLTTEAALTSSRRLKILLTEDMAVNQIVAQRMLEELGHQVIVAANGLEALDLFRTIKFDLIFMDIRMPVMDGLTATAQIRNLETERRRRHTPVVAVTAHALKGDREKYLTKGFDNYLSKPILMAELAKMIEDMIKSWNLEGEPNPALADNSTGKAPRPAPKNDSPEPGPDAAGPDPKSPGLRAIDPEVIRLSFGGNQQLFQKSLELYLRDAPPALDKIAAALAEGDTGELAAQAHALKGISGYYTKGAPFLLAQDLDQRSRQATWPEDREQLTQLAAELRAAVNILMDEMKAGPSLED